MPSTTRSNAPAVVYTDGGAEPNPGIGGWGAVIVDPVTGEQRELSGGDPVTTNNRMELTAALRALEALEPGREVDLFTDSSYVRNGITKWLSGWKAGGWRTRGGDPLKNDDLWRELERATARHRVRWHWVKGHSGQELNERAHTLASAEIARQRGAARRADVPSGAGERGKAGAVSGTLVGEESERAPLAPADAEVLLKLSCVGGRGAWAARVRSSFADEVIGGEASGTTANRLELEAAAELLSVLPDRATVDWRGGSDYLRDGASKWLEGWRRRGYRTSSGDPVKNADVWRRLEKLLASHRVRFGPATDEDREEMTALEREVKRRLGPRR